MALSDAQARNLIQVKMARFRLKMAHLKATRYRLMARLAAEKASGSRGHSVGDGVSLDTGNASRDPGTSHPRSPT